MGALVGKPVSGLIYGLCNRAVFPNDLNEFRLFCFELAEIRGARGSFSGLVPDWLWTRGLIPDLRTGAGFPGWFWEWRDLVQNVIPLAYMQ